MHRHEHCTAGKQPPCLLPVGAVPLRTGRKRAGRHRDPGRRCSSWRHPAMAGADWPVGLCRAIMGGRLLTPVPGDDQDAAINVHQLSAGHWRLTESHLHRIGPRPALACAGCQTTAGGLPKAHSSAGLKPGGDPPSPPGLHPPAARGDGGRLGRSLNPPHGTSPEL